MHIVLFILCVITAAVVSAFGPSIMRKLFAGDGIDIGRGYAPAVGTRYKGPLVKSDPYVEIYHVISPEGEGIASDLPTDKT
jgi:hypothetical protein